MVSARHLFDRSCCACVEVFGRNHFAGAPIKATAMTDSLYTQAREGCNAAAVVVGRPTARNWEKIIGSVKLEVQAVQR